MNEHRDEADIRAAFERLQTDASGLETTGPLRAVTASRGRGWIRPGVLGVAAAAVVLVVGLVLWAADDGDGPDQVAAGDDAGEPDATVDTTPDAGVPAATLDGTAWFLVSGTGVGATVPILDDWPITLTFDGDVFGGTAACNGYGGRYTVEGSALSIEELAHTEMGCQPEVMVSETAFLDALREVDEAVVVDDQLVLRGPQSELVFTASQPISAAELVGQLWLLDTLDDGETATTAVGEPATLLLRSDGTFDAGTGCRRLSGDYVLSVASVQLTSFSATGECPSRLTDQDSFVIGVLEGGFTAQIEGDRLILQSSGGEGLGYVALDEEPGPTPTPDPEQPALTVGELLDQQPSGTVAVSGYLLQRGGGWIICDALLEDDPPRGCGGRWAVITNYDRQLDPHTEPPTPRDEAAVAAAEASDDDALVHADGVVWTTEPVTELVVLVDASRVALPAWPTDAELSSDESELLDLFTALDASQGTVDVAALRLSEAGVVLGLGDQHTVTRSPAELADPAQWILDVEDFRARTGPFSALAALTEAGDVTWSAGPHDHCASPPMPILSELGDARQLSIQPTEVTSCIEWFTVDVFLDDSGAVIAIVFDTWEP